MSHLKNDALYFITFLFTPCMNGISILPRYIIKNNARLLFNTQALLRFGT